METSSALETCISSLAEKVYARNDNRYKFTLNELIAEVQSEIRMRKNVYAKHVIAKTKTIGEANKKIAAMAEIELLLKNLRDGHIIRTDCTLFGHPILIEYHGLRSPYREENLKEHLKLIFEKANDNGDRF